MSVPKYNELYNNILDALQDGKVHTGTEVRAYIAEIRGIMGEDLAELLPSGKQTVFANRVGWACTYLKKAGLIESPARAKFSITVEGRSALASAEKIDNEFLARYQSFQQFQKSTEHETNNVQIAEQEQSPEEILEGAFSDINSNLASDLMEEVMKFTPTDFEKLVVRLLLKMGYGSGIDNAGFVTKASGDGGIDGIIKEDQLGFSSIYIQAKQWQPSTKVDRPEVQKFAGALQGVKASKGLFITTAGFSAKAREYAENLHGSTIVLVDGNQLMKLMIKINLGVSVEHTYEVKRIDSDFFNEGL